jgi:hypothetical protein
MKLTILIISLLLASCRPERIEAPPEAKPSIYITRTDKYRTINGDTIWILEYTINGETQNPGFDSQEAMTRYAEYLETIGEVYRGEEE